MHLAPRTFPGLNEITADIFPLSETIAEHVPADRFPIAGRLHSSERERKKFAGLAFRTDFRRKKQTESVAAKASKFRADFYGASPGLRALKPSSPGRSWLSGTTRLRQDEGLAITNLAAFWAFQFRGRLYFFIYLSAATATEDVVLLGD